MSGPPTADRRPARETNPGAGTADLQSIDRGHGDTTEGTADHRQDGLEARRALAEALRARGAVPARRRAPATPYQRRSAAAARLEPLPGMTLRGLRARDPLAGMAGQLAVEIEGHSASLRGVPRWVARDLALDAGLATMVDPGRREQVIRATDVERFVEHVVARGLTVVVRPEAVA